MSSEYLKLERKEIPMFLLTVTTNSKFTVCRARYQTKLNRVHRVFVHTEKKLCLRKIKQIINI